MITFAVEPLCEQRASLADLIEQHHRELAQNQDTVQLSPQWDIYGIIERAGQLIFVVAREAGEIIGYFIGFIQPGLHYKDCLVCQMDALFIRPDKRNGWAGVKLFRFLETELKRRGVQRWFVGSTVRADASALFRRVGFEPSEVYYSKWIGD